MGRRGCTDGLGSAGFVVFVGRGVVALRVKVPGLVTVMVKLPSVVSTVTLLPGSMEDHTWAVLMTSPLAGSAARAGVTTLPVIVVVYSLTGGGLFGVGVGEELSFPPGEGQPVSIIIAAKAMSGNRNLRGDE